jgi:hypothetical protein
MTRENCLLWVKAAQLAREKGFIMSRNCPMDSVCSGERCVFLKNGKCNSKRVEKFYQKLQKHVDLIH